MADSTGTGDSDTLGKMLRLLESIDARMERGEKRAAEKDTARASAEKEASALKTNDAAAPVSGGDGRVLGMLSEILGALKDRVEGKKSALSFGEREFGIDCPSSSGRNGKRSSSGAGC